MPRPAVRVLPVLVSVLVLAALLAAGAPARAAGDARRGADVFAEECGDCHSAQPGKDKKGPSLSGVIGRRAGTVPGFAGYSEGLKASGIVWTPELVDGYLQAPRKVVPGGRMKYDGLPDAARRADVMAFIQQFK